MPQRACQLRRRERTQAGANNTFDIAPSENNKLVRRSAWSNLWAIFATLSTKHAHVAQSDGIF